MNEKKKEPLFHIVKRDAIPWYQSLGIRAVAIVLALTGTFLIATHGNIKNSVNFPNCVVPYNGKPRITVCHQNIVNMIGQLGAVFTKYSVNIDKLVNNSKGDLAYNIVVCDNLPENIDDMIKDLYAINTVLKVRILD